MVFREVSVIEIGEALRAWLAGKSERAVAGQAGVDRKTGKRYVTAAGAAGLSREGGEEQLTDELVGQVVPVGRPARPGGHGVGGGEMEARREQITGWVKAGVPVVKIGILLGRHGVVVVAERTLHRFAAERCAPRSPRAGNVVGSGRDSRSYLPCSTVLGGIDLPGRGHLGLEAAPNDHVASLDRLAVVIWGCDSSPS